MPRTVLVLAFVVAACGGEIPEVSEAARSMTASPALLMQDAREDLFAADDAQTAAIAALGPVEGLLQSLRGNAVYLAAGIDIKHGMRDIRDALVAENSELDTSLARTVAGGDVSADGNFGFTFGWLQRVAPSGVTYGTYVAVWERADGEDFRVTAYYTRSTPFPHIPARDGFPLFLGGAGAGGVPHAGGNAEQRRSVIAADTDFAALSVAKGVSVAFPAYADPALLMAFGRNFVGFVGLDEITAAYAGSTPGEVLDWKPVYAGAAGSGDLAYTVGTAVDSLTEDGAVTTSYSKYLTLWARMADGSWRFIADGGAPSPAPAPAPSPAPEP